MKKIILLILVSLTLSSFDTIQQDDFSIVGKWQIKGSNKTNILTFQADGFILMEQNGEVMGGEGFELQGKKANIQYEVDYSNSPFTIDINMSVVDEDLKDSILLLAEIIDNDNVKVSFSYNGVRPTSFDDQDVHIIQRVKE